MKPPAAVFLISLLALTAAQAGLLEIENQYRAAFELGVATKYAAALEELDGKYSGALERAMQQSTQSGRLEEALALKEEMQRVKDKGNLPEKDDGAPPALAKFRETYRGQIAKLRADRDKATAPIVEKFVKDTKTDWPRPSFTQVGDHPVLLVSWMDATAFCDWLTKEERRKRKIGPKDTYRLPSDHEWSCGLGTGKDEDPSLTPVAKIGKVPGYLWGKDFVPPARAGNYSGEETKRNPGSAQPPIPGYTDGFEYTAPVGSFPANRFGLYDLGGNVWEWCQEWGDPSIADVRVLRGGSWNNGLKFTLESSYRLFFPPARRDVSSGFRVVLEVGSGG